jgi:transposase-like protein
MRELRTNSPSNTDARRERARRINAIYRAENADMALLRLEEFEAAWGKRYPAIGQIWRGA